MDGFKGPQLLFYCLRSNYQVWKRQTKSTLQAPALWFEHCTQGGNIFEKHSTIMQAIGPFWCPDKPSWLDNKNYQNKMENYLQNKSVQQNQQTIKQALTVHSSYHQYPLSCFVWPANKSMTHIFIIDPMQFTQLTHWDKHWPLWMSMSWFGSYMTLDDCIIL